MLDYTGVKCPVCGIPFQTDDDIVVCPECGAPYHRECYQKEGRCIFPNLHEQGKDWEPPAPPKVSDTSSEIKDRECPRCGVLNGHSALFCVHCGASLLGEPQQHNAGPARTSPGQTFPHSPSGQAAGGYGAPPFAFDPMGGVSPADVLDSGVTFGDASKLVKQNTNYYMPVFRYLNQTRRNKFNFSAFLFSGAWLLYRKQYKSGAVVTGLMFAIYLLFLCTFWLVSWPTLSALASQAGVDLTQTLTLTNEQILAMSSLLSQDLASYLKIILPFLCLGALLIFMIVIGVRGNKMYLKHCVRTVRLVKAEGCDGDPNMTLDAKGGVNAAVSVCVTVCYVLIRNVLPMLLM